MKPKQYSNSDFEWTKVGVIPTPDVDVIDLKENYI
jgi:hypothetical protein